MIDVYKRQPSDSELILRIKKGLLCGSPKERRLRSGRTAASCHMAAVKKSPLAAAARIAGNVLFGVLLMFMALLAFFLVQSKYMGGSPSVFGYRIYAVLSGSMNPVSYTHLDVYKRQGEHYFSRTNAEHEHYKAIAAENRRKRESAKSS